MKNVMVRAWEIARRAVVRFGGKVKEYFAQALAMAWAEAKNDSAEKVIIVVDKDNKEYRLEARTNKRTYNYVCKDTNSFKDKRAHCFYNLGIKVYDYYVVENGIKRFGERVVA